MKITKWCKREKPSLDLIKKELEKEGLECFLFASEPGDFYSEHKHEYDEIRIVIEGSIKFASKDKEVILKEGDRLDLPRDTTHTAEILGSKRCVLLSATKY